MNNLLCNYFPQLHDCVPTMEKCNMKLWDCPSVGESTPWEWVWDALWRGGFPSVNHTSGTENKPHLDPIFIKEDSSLFLGLR